MAITVPAPKDPSLSPLFEPLKLGDVEVANRVFMAPLTRNRAHPDGTPSEIAVEYYRQRASAGLIITEATQISPMGKGYINTPGIHEDGHVAAWKKITDAVHAEGGKIALQLWHVGRISHSSLLPDGAQPVAPTAIRANAQTVTGDGFVDVSEPRALKAEEIKALVRDYVVAARRAMEAGFDLVEVHAANGYLLNQFLVDRSNQRDDIYGGAPENRARFLFEVLEAVTNEVGAGRVGVRLSPTGAFNDMGDTDPEATYGVVYEGLNRFDLAYLHVVEGDESGGAPAEDLAIIDRLRPLYKGVYIANSGFDARRAADVIATGRTDAVTFGKPFISNPDLPARFATNAALTEADKATFYGGDERGYTDYPFLDGAA